MFKKEQPIPLTNRIKTLNVRGLDKIKIKPWTNRNTLIFQQALEDLGEEKDFDKVLELQYEYLIKPNILEAKNENFSVVQKQILLVELYKISRGSSVGIEYFCTEENCGQRNEDTFDLSKDVYYKDMKIKNIKIKEYEFILDEYNDYTPTSIENNLENTKYILGFIKEIKYKNNKVETENIIDYILDEVDEKVFIQLIRDLTNEIPYTEFKKTSRCEKCDKEYHFSFKGIPDFSIGSL